MVRLHTNKGCADRMVPCFSSALNVVPPCILLAGCRNSGPSFLFRDETIIQTLVARWKNTVESRFRRDTVAFHVATCPNDMPNNEVGGVRNNSPA
jgi:hypothetical protein